MAVSMDHLPCQPLHDQAVGVGPCCPITVVLDEGYWGSSGRARGGEGAWGACPGHHPGCCLTVPPPALRSQLGGCGILGVGIWLAATQGNFATLSSSFPSLSAANLLIVTGTFVMAIGFVGCIGAIKENKCLLLTVSGGLGAALEDGSRAPSGPPLTGQDRDSTRTCAHRQMSGPFQDPSPAAAAGLGVWDPLVRCS